MLAALAVGVQLIAVVSLAAVGAAVGFADLAEFGVPALGALRLWIPLVDPAILVAKVAVGVRIALAVIFAIDVWEAIPSRASREAWLVLPHLALGV